MKKNMKDDFNNMQVSGNDEMNSPLCTMELSLEELKSFIKLNKLEEEPPIKYAILNCDYEGTVENDNILINASLNIEVYSPNWTTIQVVQNDGIIESSKCENGGSFGYSSNGYSFIVKGNGNYKLKLSFYLPFQSKDRKNSFKLISFGNGKLNLKILKPDLSCNLSSALGTQITYDKNSTIISAFLNNGELIVGWSPKIEEKQKKNVKPIIYGEVQTALTIGEALMRCNSRINYTIYQAGVIYFEAKVIDAKVMSVSGNGIKQYDIIPENENSIIKIYLEYETDSKFSCDVYYEKNLQQGSVKDSIPVIVLQNVDRENGFLSISNKSNIEIKIEEQQKLTVIDSKELPNEMRKASVLGSVYSFKYLGSPYKLFLDIKRHEEIPVLVSIAENGVFSTVVLEEGKIISSVVLQIRNNSKPFLNIDLPKGGVCLSSFVNGVAIKPIRNEEGKIMLPILKSDSEKELFNVEYVWILENKKMEKSGEIEVELGKIDIPISRLFLKLFVPKEYKYKDFRGNIKRVDYFQNFPQIVTKPYISPGSPSNYMPAPKVQAQYKDDGFDECNDCEEQNMMYDKKKEMARMPVMQTASVSKGSVLNSMANFGGAVVGGIVSQFSSYEKETISGTLPVRIEIPQTGIQYYFEKFFVNDETPKLKIYYKKIFKWFGKSKEVKPLNDDEK